MLTDAFRLSHDRRPLLPLACDQVRRIFPNAVFGWEFRSLWRIDWHYDVIEEFVVPDRSTRLVEAFIKIVFYLFLCSRRYGHALFHLSCFRLRA
jgi:hypothetical protein